MFVMFKHKNNPFSIPLFTFMYACVADKKEKAKMLMCMN